MNAKPAIKQTILAYIKAYQLSYGYPPTLKEIGKALGMSTSAVHYHQKGMIEAGTIERRGHSPRAIKIL